MSEREREKGSHAAKDHEQESNPEPFMVRVYPVNHRGAPDRRVVHTEPHPPTSTVPPDGPTHLHGVGLPRARLSVGEDADVEAVDARGHQRLDLLEHLRTGRTANERSATPHVFVSVVFSARVVNVVM